MPFTIHTTEEGLRLELTGGVTVRDAQELYKRLTSSLASGTKVTVLARDLDDIDTNVVQMLISLRKTASTFAIQDASPALLTALERCGLRRELLSGASL